MTESPPDEAALRANLDELQTTLQAKYEEMFAVPAGPSAGEVKKGMRTLWSKFIALIVGALLVPSGRSSSHGYLMPSRPSMHLVPPPMPKTVRSTMLVVVAMNEWWFAPGKSTQRA